VLVSLEVIADVHARIAEKVQRLTTRFAVANAVEDRLRRMPLVHKQRGCRDSQLVSLGLSGPVEERFAHLL
jgi:hypothetical protein